MIAVLIFLFYSQILEIWKILRRRCPKIGKKTSRWKMEECGQSENSNWIQTGHQRWQNRRGNDNKLAHCRQQRISWPLLYVRWTFGTASWLHNPTSKFTEWWKRRLENHPHHPRTHRLEEGRNSFQRDWKSRWQKMGDTQLARRKNPFDCSVAEPAASTKTVGRPFLFAAVKSECEWREQFYIFSRRRSSRFCRQISQSRNSHIGALVCALVSQ